MNDLILAYGPLTAKVRRHWWQVWLPKTMVIGTWRRVGDVVHLTVKVDPYPIHVVQALRGQEAAKP